MSEQANKTPLVDLLRAVPIDHRTEWVTQYADDGTTAIGVAFAPIGIECHAAADEIERLQGELNNARKVLTDYGTHNPAIERVLREARLCLTVGE